MSTAIDLATLSVDERRSMLATLLAGQTGTGAPHRSDYERFVNPHLGALLRHSMLERSFVRGEGCTVWDAHGRAYLDFTSAFGALPFGFNPARIWSAIEGVRRSGEPSFTQPSAQPAAAELAKRLLRAAPGDFATVTYANSGAEAIEAAIKMARAAKQRPMVVSTRNGFHGKTLGALSASMRPQYQHAFGAPLPGFVAVPYGDAAALAECFDAHRGKIAAFIVEPIQGEGGVNTPSPDYLRTVRALCDRDDVLMVVDEVQTGLGRTGSLFACGRLGVAPDILTLAKALGGGLVPMAAVLAGSKAMTEDFAFKHTSTFAANTIGCRVGIAVLDALEEDGGALVAAVARNGARLRRGLEEIRDRSGGVLKAVRGEGYLLGVEFSDDYGVFPRQGLIPSLATQQSLVLAVGSWLLNVEQVRVMPTVFESRVLRVEPPLIAGMAECETFLSAFGRAVDIIRDGDTVALTAHLAEADDRSPRATPAVAAVAAAPVARAHPDEPRWGFLVHPLDLASYRDMDDGLARLSDTTVATIVDRLNGSRFTGVSRSLVLGAMRITSPLGATAVGEVIAIPRTAAELLRLPVAEAASLVGEAVDLARERGATIVGLGGFTSIVTRNGLDLADAGVHLTTGNGYTAINSAQTVLAALSAIGSVPEAATVAIIGAAGAVGRATALLLAGRVGRLILVGNPEGGAASLTRLEEVAGEVRGACPADRRCAGIGVTIDIGSALADADAAVTATSNVDTLIHASAVRPGTIVCDTARPSNVDPALVGRDDVLAVDGGLVVAGLDGSRALNYGLGAGVTYACMAETFLLSLAGEEEAGSIGARLELDHLVRLRRLASRHGFACAPLQIGKTPIDAARIAGVRAAAASRRASIRR